MELENKIEEISKLTFNILLVIIDAGKVITNELTSYMVLKHISLPKGIISQVVDLDTINQPYALSTITLGILAKTNNILYVLGKEIECTDYIVGIDISRTKKKNLAGTINIAATARVFSNTGELLHYMIRDEGLEGETIPEHILKSFFPHDIFKGKRVIVHRDGYFRGKEEEILKNWGNEIGATFQLVEIIKTNQPRIYEKINNDINRAGKGTAFLLNNNSAIVVSTSSSIRDSTPQPLKIQTKNNFNIDNAILSVLALTKVHQGSVLEPRLPITIHYSDKIAGLSLKGIRPRDSEGNLPYWL